MDEVQVIQGQADAYNARDLDGFLSYYSPNVVIEDGAGDVMIQGIDALRDLMGTVFSQSPQLHVDIPKRIHTGQWVIDEEHVSDFHLEGFPTEYVAAVVYQVQDGKITGFKLLI
jgi:hypothetical protein